jgi:hypothetical protein
MSPIESEDRITCPHCGASTVRRLSFCTICRARLRTSQSHDVEEEPPRTEEIPDAGPGAAARPLDACPHYTLASLMLLTALIGVFLGLTVHSLAYGIIFAFLCIPALIRTIRINRRRKAKGHRMAFSEKILAFGASLGVVVVVAAASGGTLTGCIFFAVFATGSGLRNGGAAFALTMLAFVAAGLVGMFLLRWLWPPRDGW